MFIPYLITEFDPNFPTNESRETNRIVITIHIKIFFFFLDFPLPHTSATHDWWVEAEPVNAYYERVWCSIWILENSKHKSNNNFSILAVRPLELHILHVSLLEQIMWKNKILGVLGAITFKVHLFAIDCSSQPT